MDSVAARPRFEDVWFELEPKLRRALQTCGTSPDLEDDLIQETSIRLWCAWDQLDHSTPLLAFARRVALNLRVDDLRRRRPLPMAELPETESCYDLEDHVFARETLSLAKAALESLNPSERTALLAEVGIGERGNNSAFKMARLRARRSLRSALEGVAAAFGGALMPIKRTLFSLGEIRTAEIAPVIVGATAMFSAAIMSVPSPSDPPRASQRGPVPQEVTISAPTQTPPKAGEEPTADRKVVSASTDSHSEPDLPPISQRGPDSAGSEPSDEMPAAAGSGKSDRLDGTSGGSTSACTDEPQSEPNDPSISVLSDEGSHSGSGSNSDPESCA
ncbi:MAG: RNA polymerase sigma factor [Actinomycetota bacterium]